MEKVFQSTENFNNSNKKICFQYRHDNQLNKVNFGSFNLCYTLMDN